MFVDEVLMRAGGNTQDPRDTHLRSMFDCPRFFLTPEVVEVAKGLETADQKLFWPAPRVWFEWHGPGPFPTATRHGIQMLAEEDGMDAIYWATAPIPEHGSCALMLIFKDGKINVLKDGSDDEKLAQVANCVDWGSFIRILQGTILLLTSPRAITYREPDLSVLNRKRERRGKPALLTYSEVRLNLSPEERAMSRAGVGIGGKALHRVRPFARLRLGKVELVRQHWRGNVANGMVLASHKVTL